MPSRYYFLSSLPMLNFNEKAPISWEKFIEDAKGNINQKDYKELCAIAENKKSGSHFLKKWESLNCKLDQSINFQRRKNLGREIDSQDKTAFREFEIEQVTQAVMSAKNPLEAEMVLMKFKYDYLEREKGFDAFTKNALLSYALQLKILLRKDLFTTEAGNKQYNQLFDKLQKEMKME